MESFKILNEKENPLFNRKEIQVSVESQTNPKKQEIKDLLSEKLSVPKENIKIKKISGNFGSRTFNINANIYSSKEDKEFLEKEKKPEKQESSKKIEVQQTEQIKESAELKNKRSQGRMSNPKNNKNDKKNNKERKKTA